MFGDQHLVRHHFFPGSIQIVWLKESSNSDKQRGLFLEGRDPRCGLFRKLALKASGMELPIRMGVQSHVGRHFCQELVKFYGRKKVPTPIDKGINSLLGATGKTILAENIRI